MTIVGILGTVHTDYMRKEFGFSLEFLESIIAEFRPDIICGEVRQEDYDKYLSDKTYDGYLGPSEYRATIIKYCESRNTGFIPVDWFEDGMATDYLAGKSDVEIEQFQLEFDLIMDKYIEIGKSSSIPFNSDEFNQLVFEKQALQKRVNPEIHNIVWDERNRKIFSKILSVIEANPSKRVLCTIGAEHSYYIESELKKHNVKIEFPLKIGRI